jgi:hypothetical protein
VRLWSIHPRYLDSQGLVALWREALLARAVLSGHMLSYLNPALSFFYGNRVRQITGVAAQSRVFGEEVLCHPFYTRVCDAVLGPNCASYQLNVAQVMDRGPGTEQQLLHRDEDVWVHLARCAEWPETREKLREQTAHARALGVFGAPSLVVEDELFWGNDRLEAALAWRAKG